MLQQQEQDPTNLYLSNLPVSMDEQELENLLKPFGQVISTRILRDAHGMSRGVGFARSVLIFVVQTFLCVPSISAPSWTAVNHCVQVQLCMHLNQVSGKHFVPVRCVNTSVSALFHLDVSCLRMESTEKCDAVISHFNGKFIKSTSGMLGN